MCPIASVELEESRFYPKEVGDKLGIKSFESMNMMDIRRVD